MIRTLCVALGLVALATMLLVLSPPSDELARPTGSEPAIGDQPSTLTKPSFPEGIDAAVPRPGRNVTPDGLTSVPPADGPLRRLPPREPESVEEKSGETVGRETRHILLPRPIARNTGQLAIGRGTVILPGIVPFPLERTCGEGAGAWPCGMRARTELRNYLRSRSIRCDVPEDFGERDEAVTSACTLRGEDIGDWIVRNGWAAAVPGGPYQEVEADARRERRGVWQ